MHIIDLDALATVTGGQSATQPQYEQTSFLQPDGSFAVKRPNPFEETLAKTLELGRKYGWD
jgi:hypothetical protein